MTVQDSAAIAQLEALWPHHGWSAAQCVDSLQAGCTGWVLVDASSVLAAYALVMSVSDEASILIFGVAPSRQRQGWGGQLLQHIVKEIKKAGATKLFLDVRAGNTAALALYAGQGFAQIGVRRGYYAVSGGYREDAIVMQKIL